MSDLVIRCESIGKQYQIGERERYKALRDVISDAMFAPFRRLRSLSQGSSGVTSRVTKPTIWALNDVSFDVRRGEVLGVIGRNGAGKSTLLKILSRITEPTRGWAQIRGRIGSLLEVGTGFHPELTGRENVFLNGAILGMRKVEIIGRFDEIVAFSEVEEFIDTPVKHYSSGMYMRLAFAVAAHLETEILLVDEVLAVGDTWFQKKCLNRMDEVRKAGRTVLFVTHNLGAASNLCTRGLLLDSGRIHASGAISDTIAQYITLGQQSGSERRWDDVRAGPGDDTVRISAVRVVSQNGATADVRIDSDLWIEIEFVNYEPGAYLAPGIHLLDQNKSVVLSSANLPSMCSNCNYWAGKPHPAGVFRSRCRIPANFLNEGRYTINALLMADNQRVAALAEEVVSFMVHETGQMRKEFTARWIGSIRPRLDWETELTGDLVKGTSERFSDGSEA